MVHWTERKTRTLAWAVAFSLVAPLAGALFLFDSFSWEQVGFALRQGIVAGILVTSGVYVYHLSVRRFTTPSVHPERRLLGYLLIGTGAALLALALKKPLDFALGIGIVTNLGIAFALRRRLFWDALFASISLGAVFALASIITSTVLPSPLDDLWFSHNSLGLFLGSTPIQQIIIMGGLGMLWGPLFSYLKEPKNNWGDNPAFGAHHVRTKAYIATSFLLVALSAGGWFSYSYLFKPQLVSAKLATPDSVPLNAEIKIDFSRPVHSQDIRLSVAPPIEGTWEFSDTALGNRAFSSLTFKPTEVFVPDQEYKIVAEDVKSVIGTGAETHTVTFHSEPVPTIASVIPEKGAVAVSACTPLEVHYEHALSEYWQPTFIVTPSAELEITRDGAKYSLVPKQCLEQGTAYTLNATLMEKTEELTNFQTTTAPGITTHEPQGNEVLVSTERIMISFTKAMNTTDPSSFIRIEPSPIGTWEWNADGTTLSYVLSAPLAHNTRYTTTILKGLTDQTGGVLESDATVSFTTIVHARVSGFSPTPSAQDMGIETTVQVSFSQSVVTPSAEERFTIEPAVAGTFSWKGNRVTFSPTGLLSYSTTYTVTVAKGVQSVHGLETLQDYTASFTTKTAPIPPATPITMGLSEQGRAINGYVFGTGSNVIFIHGGVHSGKERSNVVLLERLVKEINANKSLVGENTKVVIVPNANPDAYATRSDKYNSRDVNINLNFQTSGWVAFGASEEAPNAGSEPFSERESRVIRDIALTYNASSMIAFHSRGGLVNPEMGHGPSQALARRYAQKSGYGYYEEPDWDYPGTATKWFLESVGGPSITVELTSHTVADWSNHKNALFELIK